MKTILSNWTLFRAIRLILGIAILIKGIADGEYIFALAGAFLSIMAVANLGCCSTAGCAVPPPSKQNNTAKQPHAPFEKTQTIQ